MALVQIVSGIIEDYRGKVLLVDRGEGKFGFPAGIVNTRRGKQPVDVLKRLIREQASSTLVSPRLLDKYRGYDSAGNELEFLDLYATEGSGTFASNPNLCRVRWVDVYSLMRTLNNDFSNSRHRYSEDLLSNSDRVLQYLSLLMKPVMPYLPQP